MAYVYVIRCKSNVTKIGITVSPKDRLCRYRGERAPDCFQVGPDDTYSCLWECPDESYKDVETTAKSILSARFHKVRYEGFVCPVFEAVDAVHQAANEVGTTLARTEPINSLTCESIRADEEANKKSLRSIAPRIDLNVNWDMERAPDVKWFFLDKIEDGMDESKASAFAVGLMQQGIYFLNLLNFIREKGEQSEQTRFCMVAVNDLRLGVDKTIMDLFECGHDMAAETLSESGVMLCVTKHHQSILSKRSAYIKKNGIINDFEFLNSNCSRYIETVLNHGTQ